MQQRRCAYGVPAMARKTIASLEAQVAALEAGNAGLQYQLDELRSRIRHDYVEVAEYRRVQALLRTTQQFAAKYKQQAQGGERAPSERRQAMEAARAAAMASGKTVAVQL